MTYDLRSRKTSMTDPDMGLWYYAYDAAGQMIWQKDAKAQVSTLSYDILGRMTSRNETDLVSTLKKIIGDRPEWHILKRKQLSNK